MFCPLVPLRQSKNRRTPFFFSFPTVPEQKSKTAATSTLSLSFSPLFSTPTAPRLLSSGQGLVCFFFAFGYGFVFGRVFVLCLVCCRLVLIVFDSLYFSFRIRLLP